MHVGCFAAVYGNLSGLKKKQTGVSTFHCFVNTCAFATPTPIVGFTMCHLLKFEQQNSRPDAPCRETFIGNSTNHTKGNTVDG